MRYINQSKPIKFSLLVGDRECHSVEEVKQNFDFNSLWDNLCNGSLEKWLGQIGETAMLLHNKELVSADSLTKKMCIYNLFAPEPLPSDEVNEDNVLKLLKKGCIKFDDLSGTHFADNIEIKKSVIEKTDNDTLNRLCESDLEVLEYVYYNKKSYDNLNAKNCRTLINQKIVTNEDLAMEIAIRKNLNDILERLGRLIIVRVDGIDIEMILVKGYQGCDFYIGKYPVTQKQWQAVMGNNPSKFKGEDNPVECVSWDDRQAFLKKLYSKTEHKFRLPNEAEWEFAARGGNKTHNYTFSGSNNSEEVGWFESDSGQQTHPVGMKKPNELGIYDMSGNVWEWSETRYIAGYIARGGSWFHSTKFCDGFAHRDFDHGRRDDNLGFRLAMDV